MCHCCPLRTLLAPIRVGRASLGGRLNHALLIRLWPIHGWLQHLCSRLDIPLSLFGWFGLSLHPSSSCSSLGTNGVDAVDAAPISAVLFCIIGSTTECIRYNVVLARNMLQ